MVFAMYGSICAARSKETVLSVKAIFVFVDVKRQVTWLQRESVFRLGTSII